NIVIKKCVRYRRLWNPYVLTKSAGVLEGHLAPITNIIVSHQEGYIISLSEDKNIRIWDTRTLSCIQSIWDKAYTRPENSITAIFYDDRSKNLMSGTNTLDIWPINRNARFGTAHYIYYSHDAPIVSALYNEGFDLVVSACQNSVVSIWNFSSGNRTFKFSNAHKTEITALCFDTSGRRLITGGRDGLVIDSNCEVTKILHVELGQNKFVLVVGWDKRISVFVDNPNIPESKAVRHIRVDGYGSAYRGHEDDVLSMAFLPPNKLVTSGIDGKIIVWNFNSGHERLIMREPLIDAKSLDERPIESVILKNEH
ncbi:WD40 repeat-like protein, partial [Rozella allomycis CSF55]